MWQTIKYWWFYIWRNLPQIILTILGWGGTTVIINLQNISPFIPIFAIAISIGLTINAIYRINRDFQKWKYIYEKAEPSAQEILVTLRDLHLSLRELIIPISQRQVNKQTLRKLIEYMLRMLNISRSELYSRFSQSQLSDIKDSLMPKLKKSFNINPKKINTNASLLREFGYSMDSVSLGLSTEMNNNDTNYHIQNTKLQILTLKTNEDIVEIINRVKQLSFGLCSIIIAINLLNKHRNYSKKMPSNLKDELYNFPKEIDDIYMKALLEAKLGIMKSLMREI